MRVKQWETNLCFMFLSSLFSRSLAKRRVSLCFIFLIYQTNTKYPVFKKGTLLKGQYECSARVVSQNLSPMWGISLGEVTFYYKGMA